MSKKRISHILKQCDAAMDAIESDLSEARPLVEPLGMTVDSSIVNETFAPLNNNNNNSTIDTTNTTTVPQQQNTTTTTNNTLMNTVLRTTGGHSNTDHMVLVTGNPRVDWLQEWKRSYQRRVRASQPESRREARWDKPKLPGERRRRIQREKDAPPEPPPSGYVVYISQMTCKHRHDHPNVPHNQTKVVQEISKLWNGLSGNERSYYLEYAREAKMDYQSQLDEFQATGTFHPSERFERLGDGQGPWVRKRWAEKNALEREIATYETVVFPARPPEMDEAYYKRRDEGLQRRKERLRVEALAANGGKVRRKRKRRNKLEDEKEGESGGEEKRKCQGGTGSDENVGKRDGAGTT